VRTDIDADLVAGWQRHQRPTARAPVVYGPRVVRDVPVDRRIVVELRVAEVEDARPVDVAVPVVGREQRAAGLGIAEHLARLGPGPATTDVHVHVPGARLETEIVDVEAGRGEAERGIHEGVAALLREGEATRRPAQRR